jgi:hypothetical protein
MCVEFLGRLKLPECDHFEVDAQHTRITPRHRTLETVEGPTQIEILSRNSSNNKPVLHKLSHLLI